MANGKHLYHPAESRGHANHGWLESYHSFSFAGYYNPDRMQFGALRVLNDDTVAGGRGFSAHSHDNMEIISIPLSGDLEHQDSLGTKSVIKEGDVQVMSAGTGVTHSEYNKNADQEVKFLQIWIFPQTRGIAPRYDQRHFSDAEIMNTLKTIVSPADEEGLSIHQQAWMGLGSFERGAGTTYRVRGTENGVYVFLLEGDAVVDGQVLRRHDALGITGTETFDLQFKAPSKVLTIEVPMNY